MIRKSTFRKICENPHFSVFETRLGFSKIHQLVIRAKNLLLYMLDLVQNTGFIGKQAALD
jgi:hypothetical protein